jgi:hypothetical protein
MAWLIVLLLPIPTSLSSVVVSGSAWAGAGTVRATPINALTDAKRHMADTPDLLVTVRILRATGQR